VGRPAKPKVAVRALEVADAEAMARLHAMPGYRYGFREGSYADTVAMARIRGD
jgi:hypothetical protein